MTTSNHSEPSEGCTCGASVAPGHDRAGLAEDWLTPEEVVAGLRGALSLGTLRNYRSARIGPAYVRVGRAIFYPRAEVDAWLAAQVRASADRWADRA